MDRYLARSKPHQAVNTGNITDMASYKSGANEYVYAEIICNQNNSFVKNHSEVTWVE